MMEDSTVGESRANGLAWDAVCIGTATWSEAALHQSTCALVRTPRRFDDLCACLWNVHSARQRGVDTQKEFEREYSQDVQGVDVVSIALM